MLCSKLNLIGVSFNIHRVTWGHSLDVIKTSGTPQVLVDDDEEANGERVRPCTCGCDSVKVRPGRWFIANSTLDLNWHDS